MSNSYKLLLNTNFKIYSKRSFIYVHIFLFLFLKTRIQIITNFYVKTFVKFWRIRQFLRENQNVSPRNIQQEIFHSLLFLKICCLIILKGKLNFEDITTIKVPFHSLGQFFTKKSCIKDEEVLSVHFSLRV